MSLPSDLQSTSQTDLQRLVNDRVREGSYLEFKRDYPNNWDNRTKHEFLADVTAFANAGGGDLVFGIDEDADGQAVAVVPQQFTSLDEEIRRLQDLLLNQVEPRVPGVQFHATPVTAEVVEGHALALRIPQSWAGPHRVKTNQHFFVRDGARKRQLDVPEIRSLFLRFDGQARRVRDFRTDRLGKLLTGEIPHRLVEGPLLVVHFVPTQAAQGQVQIDPVVYSTRRALPVLGAFSGQARLNVDGAVAVRPENAQGRTGGYGLFFRDGFFETVYVLDYGEVDGRTVLPSRRYEQQVIDTFREFRGELGQLGISGECAVMLSLLRADRVRLAVPNTYAFLEPHQTFFDRPVVALPDVLARAELPPEQALKPAFDLMWQAAGFNGSGNYNQAGEWAPPDGARMV